MKRWKLSPIDIKARKHYEDYTEARELMLAATHTDFAPWTLVDFNDQPLGRLTLLRDLLDRVPDTELPLAEIPWPPLGHEPLEGALWRAPADRRTIRPGKDHGEASAPITSTKAERIEQSCAGAIQRGKEMRASKLLVQLTIYYLVIGVVGLRRGQDSGRTCAVICRSAGSSS